MASLGHNELMDQICWNLGWQQHNLLLLSIYKLHHDDSNTTYYCSPSTNFIMTTATQPIIALHLQTSSWQQHNLLLLSIYKLHHDDSNTTYYCSPSTNFIMTATQPIIALHLQTSSWWQQHNLLLLSIYKLHHDDSSTTYYCSPSVLIFVCQDGIQQSSNRRRHTLNSGLLRNGMSD